jgi:hypothetical protein
MTEWFRRLADVPGAGYPGSPGIDRTRLKGHDAVPEVHSFVHEGKRLESLSWLGRGRNTSASPAHELAFQSGQDESTAAVLRRVARALELPGEVSDYHFCIQGAVEALWSRRRDEPEVYDEIEGLCWIDLQLLEARPDFLTVDRAGEPGYLRVTTIERLITLYELEGFLAEALEGAERAERLHQGEERVHRLRQRIAQVEAEDVVTHSTAT